jgi:type II secretory pathway predicted ATPase ExeA
MQSLTYEPFYGLREKPFSLSADPKFLYKSPAHAVAFERLEAGIRRREGLIVLSGEIGTGKTTLCRAVLAHLDRRTFSTFVPDPFLTREDLLKTLLVGFGVMSVADHQSGRLAGASRQDLSYPLYEFLDSLVPLQAFAVLVIDEAQNLSPLVLEEIRILAELERRHKLLQVVLVGQPELRINLRRPELRQVEQRVSVRCELSPLEGDGVARYMAHRMSIAASHEDRVVFTAAAVSAIAEASGGVPRLINRICDRVLHVGWTARTWTLEAEAVHAALDDLGMDRSHSTTVGAIVAMALTAPTVPTPEPAASRVAAVAVAPPPTADVPLTLTAFMPAQASPDAPSGVAGSLAEFASESAMDALIRRDTAVRAQPRRTRGLARFALPCAAAVGLAVVVGSGGVLDVNALLGVTASSPLPPTPPSPYDVREGTTHGILPPDGFLASLTEARARAADAYTIRVGAFANRVTADQIIDALASRGHRARLVQLAGRSVEREHLEIVIDGYGTLEDAFAVVSRIRQVPGADGAIVVGMPGALSPEP